MKILITGNMGYVGPMVVKRLRESYPDATLIGLDQAFFANCLTDATVLPEYQVDVQYFSDVREIEDEKIVGVDAIVNLAAVSNDPMGKTYEAVTGAINYEAVVALAKRAKKLGVSHFVFASSCSVYGTAENAEAKTEESKLNPLTAYARSKIATEEGLKGLEDDNFIVTCLRFATACGMSPRLRLDLVLNDFVACAIAAGEITILSDGTPWRPLINVKDMARAIDWAATRKADNGGKYLSVNVGSNEWNYQVRDFAKTVADVIPGTKVSINEDAMPDKRSYKVCFDKFKELAPDYVPQMTLKSSIEGLRDGLNSMGFNDPNFRESKLIRLHVLNGLREKKLISDELRWM